MKNEKSQFTPGPRCTKCKWVHEADSIAGTSFQGVELCPEHAAAPDLLAALEALINGRDVNDYRAYAAARSAIAKARGGEGAQK